MPTTPADLTRVSFGRLNDNLVLPATPTMLVARMSTESVAYAPNIVESPELDPSGQLRDSVMVGSASAGGVEFPMVRSDWFHAMLAAVFRNEWGVGNLGEELVPGDGNFTNRPLGPDELIPAKLLHYYDMEKLFETPVEQSFHVIRRCAVGNVALRVTPNDILAGTVTLAGGELDATNAPIAGATYPDPGTWKVFTSPNVTEVSISGITNPQCFNALTLNFNSNIRGIACIGEEAEREKSAGRFVPTIDGTSYFVSNEHVLALRAQTDLKVTVTLTDGSGNEYSFYYPRGRFVTAPVTTPGTNQDVMQPMSIRGHYSPEHGYSCLVTRTLAATP